MSPEMGDELLHCLIWTPSPHFTKEENAFC